MNFSIDYILGPSCGRFSTHRTISQVENNNTESDLNINTSEVMENSESKNCETIVEQLNEVIEPSKVNSIFHGDLIVGIDSKSISSRSENESKINGPFCAKCKLHKEYFHVRKHKTSCARRFCHCQLCELVDKGKIYRSKKFQGKFYDSDRKLSFRDCLSIADKYSRDLKFLISQESAPGEKSIEKLLNSVLYFLLERNSFDMKILKKKFHAVKQRINLSKRMEISGIQDKIRNFSEESFEVICSSCSTLPTAEESNIDRSSSILYLSSVSTDISQSLPPSSLSLHVPVIATNYYSLLSTSPMRKEPVIVSNASGRQQSNEISEKSVDIIRPVSIAASTAIQSQTCNLCLVSHNFDKNIVK